MKSVGTDLQSRIAAGEFPPAPTTPHDLHAFAALETR